MSSAVATVTQDEPVTVMISRRVRPGRQAEFEALCERIGGEAQRFTGYMDRRIIRPRDHQHPEYVIIFKFDCYTHLKAWEESPIRRELLKHLKPFVLDRFREQVLTGLEQWFTLPFRPELPPPPKYKMAVMVLVVVYPLAFGIGQLLGPFIATLPAALRGLVVSIIMVLLMTYVVMPRVTRLFRHWLYPDAT